jgi:hypothetical protein
MCRIPRDGCERATREERLRQIRANLARVYYPEPVKLSEWMKAQIRKLKHQAGEDAPDNDAPDIVIPSKHEGEGT